MESSSLYRKKKGAARSLIIFTLILITLAALFYVATFGIHHRRFLIDAEASESPPAHGYRRLLASVTHRSRVLIEAQPSESPSSPGH
nr:hypothetical protein Itr_chr03CG13860 [Ipomoea trifida]GMC69799.1 hypothetical protein Iba_chr03aCG9950 [Ipomoea batatas]GMC75875.1 hypothetical protein Iba_chr03dCG9030 [Ipomoea batatas]